MRILLINHYAGSLSMGMEYRPYYMAREWAKLGHTVLIAAATHSHVRTQQPEEVDYPQIRDHQGVSYFWIPSTEYKGNGFGRLKNMARFVAGLFKSRRYLADWKPDVVIASSTYPMDIFPAKSIAKRCSAKLVFEVHDLWPLSPMELGGMSKYHPFIILVQYAEDFACRNADAVVSMLPCAKDHLVSRGMPPENFSHVPNGVILDDCDDGQELSGEIDELITAERKRGSLVVAYTGAHGVANALTVVLNACRILSDDRVAFFLIGGGPEKDSLKETALKMGLENVHFFDPISKNSIPSLLSKMDVLYIGLQRQPLFRFGISPNKLMDYMMAGKPIIQAIDAGNDMVKYSECGLSIPPEDPQELADAIRTMVKMSVEAKAEMGELGRRYVRKYHDYKKLAKRFLDGIAE